MIWDVIVLGGGPAGCSVAARIAQGGARVCLLTSPSRPGWEGLSMRSLDLLGDEGLDVGEAGISGPFARTGRWAAGRDVQGVEWLCDRAELAHAFRSLAHRLGVEVVPTRVMACHRDGREWSVVAGDGSVRRAVHVVDARGRRGRAIRGPVLLAYGRLFESRHGLEPGTHIEAQSRQWCWWGARAGHLWVHVVGRPGSGHPATWLELAVAESPALARAMEGATPLAQPRATVAHARMTRTGTDAPWSVGDAAVALDPLSGQGVYEALRGARVTATVLLDVLNGGDEALARRFLADRQSASWERSVRLAAGFYAELDEGGAFWRQTAGAYQALLPKAEETAPRVVRRPVLDGGRVVERSVLVTSGHPRGVWHVAGVPVVELKKYLDSTVDPNVGKAAEVLERPAAAVASAAAWLMRSGALAARAGDGVALGG